MSSIEQGEPARPTITDRTKPAEGSGEFIGDIEPIREYLQGDAKPSNPGRDRGDGFSRRSLIKSDLSKSQKAEVYRGIIEPLSDLVSDKVSKLEIGNQIALGLTKKLKKQSEPRWG